MIEANVILKPDERAVLSLRELYRRHGYTHYKVGKFEEYDLYAGNRSFLISDNILTFTDTNGKLMAMRPDVTLSIIKNIGDGDAFVKKLFYNENVYRTSVSSGGFREIMQTGLECIGNIDSYSVCEVLGLAAKSLETISRDTLLVISHMGFTLGLLKECSFTDSMTKEALSYVKSKNVGAIAAMAEAAGVDKDRRDALCFVTKYYGRLDEACREIKGLVIGEQMSAAYDELCAIAEAMPNSEIYLDFSVVNDMNYYDGIIFNGYVNGISESVLSGGRYDKLLEKMGKKAGAIGFAVYLDLLERLDEETAGFDADVLLVYNDSPASAVVAAVAELAESSKTVRAMRVDDGSIKYKEKIIL